MRGSVRGVRVVRLHSARYDYKANITLHLRSSSFLNCGRPRIESQIGSTSRSVCDMTCQLPICGFQFIKGRIM